MNVDSCPCGSSRIERGIISFTAIRECCFVHYYGHAAGRMLYVEAMLVPSPKPTVIVKPKS